MKIIFVFLLVLTEENIVKGFGRRCDKVQEMLSPDIKETAQILYPKFLLVREGR
jgi:hypothetical protein